MKYLILLLFFTACSHTPISHNQSFTVEQNYKTLLNQGLRNISKCWNLPFDSAIKKKMSNLEIDADTQKLIRKKSISDFYKDTTYTTVYDDESEERVEIVIRRDNKDLLTYELKPSTRLTSTITITGKNPLKDQKLSTPDVLKLITRKYDACPDEDT